MRVGDRETASFTYDALNERVRSDWGSDAQEFVYNLSGHRVSLWDSNSGTKTQRQTWWGSVPVVFSFPSGDHYQHQNSLGTERMRTTYSGAVEATFNSLPFGDGSSTTGTDNDAYHYAVLDSDSTSVTDMAQFRRYSHAQGRWMSPDPYSGSYDSANPQSMNRYTYVLNNPLSFVDPMGLYLQVACWTTAVQRFAQSGYVYSSSGGTDGTPPIYRIDAGWSFPSFCVAYDDGRGSLGSNGVAGSSNGSGQGGATNNPQKQMQQCVNKFYNSNFGKAVQFTSPLSLIRGWNPQATANMKNWGEAILGKLGGLFGSGATTGTTTLTTLSGDVTVGSTPELLLEGGLNLIEKVAIPVAAASSYVDLMAHYTCWAGANPDLANLQTQYQQY